MLFHKTLPKQADIFKQSKKHAFYNISYKSFKGITHIGILSVACVTLFGFAVLLSPASQITKDAQSVIACSSQDNGNGGCNRYWWWSRHNSNFNQNNNQNNTTSANDPTGDTQNDPVQGTFQNIDPANQTVAQPFAPFPSTNFATTNTTPQFTPIQQFQTIATTNTNPVPSIAPLDPNQLGNQDLGGISDQIAQIQQQIGQQMQSCVSNAQQMEQQIAQLQGQQTQLQNQLNATYSQQQPNFDTSTTQGQQRQQAWQQQMQQQQTQLQNQINALSDAINNAQNAMNTANSNCQQNVSQLEQNRGQLESNLDNAFNTAMNNAANPPVSPVPNQ